MGTAHPTVLRKERWSLHKERWSLHKERWSLHKERWSLHKERWSLRKERWLLRKERWSLATDGHASFAHLTELLGEIGGGRANAPTHLTSEFHSG